MRSAASWSHRNFGFHGFPRRKEHQGLRGLRCRDAQDRTHRTGYARGRRRRDREVDEGDGEEEKGGRSYVSPPPEVGGPRNRLRGRSAIRPTVSVRVPDVRSSRLASASASSNPWTNLCGRAAPRRRLLLRLPESIVGPSSRLSSRPISRPSEFTWFTSTAAPSRLPTSGCPFDVAR